MNTLGISLPSPDAVQIVFTVSTLAALWIGWAKYLGPRFKARWNRLVGFFQTIAGRDPIVDKITGREISPEVPPLGKQIAAINDNMAQLIEVVRSNQDAHHRIDGVESRVLVLETAEEARREVRAESTEMWRAVANKDVLDVESDE